MRIEGVDVILDWIKGIFGEKVRVEGWIDSKNLYFRWRLIRR